MTKVVMTIVLQAKGLTVSEIIKYARSKWNIFDYLPEHMDCRWPNRDFLCNVVNTVIPDEFELYVKGVLDSREKKMIKQRKLGVSILPEFVKIFKESKNISCKLVHV